MWLHHWMMDVGIWICPSRCMHQSCGHLLLYPLWRHVTQNAYGNTICMADVICATHLNSTIMHVYLHVRITEHIYSIHIIENRTRQTSANTWFATSSNKPWYETTSRKSELLTKHIRWNSSYENEVAFNFQPVFKNAFVRTHVEMGIKVPLFGG